MDLEASKFVVPLPPGQSMSSLTIDMQGIADAEARVQETASATVHTAPELQAFFNTVWLRLDKNITQLTHQQNLAEAALEDARADALLDSTTKKLAEMGHEKASKELREALASRNPEVKKARDTLQKIQVVLQFLRGRAKVFERTFYGLKQRRDDNLLPKEPLRGGDAPEPMQGPAQTLHGDDPWSTNKKDDVDDDFLSSFGTDRY